MTILKRSYKTVSTIFIVLLLLIFVNASISWFNSAKQLSFENETQSIERVSYSIEHDGDNVLELLQNVAEVELKEYDFGVFVESINGIKGNTKHFWSLYINNEASMVGADKVVVKQGDQVEWRYEEIK